MGDRFFFHYNGLCQRIYPSALDLVCYFYVFFGFFKARNMQYVACIDLISIILSYLKRNRSEIFQNFYFGIINCNT